MHYSEYRACDQEKEQVLQTVSSLESKLSYAISKLSNAEKLFSNISHLDSELEKSKEVFL